MPASWLVGLLLLALADVPLPAAFPAVLASFAAALALPLVDTLGLSAVAGKLAEIIGLRIGAAAGSVLLATGSRARAGR